MGIRVSLILIMMIHASQAPKLMKAAETRTTMFCLMDKILTEYANQAFRNRPPQA
jgi:hypothetical protein